MPAEREIVAGLGGEKRVRRYYLTSRPQKEKKYLKGGELGTSSSEGRGRFTKSWDWKGAAQQF